MIKKFDDREEEEVKVNFSFWSCSEQEEGTRENEHNSLLFPLFSFIFRESRILIQDLSLLFFIVISRKRDMQ